MYQPYDHRFGKEDASRGAGIEAQSLLCPRCRVAQPVRKKLLLVLPEGDKYAYFCAVCGEQVGSKLETNQERPPWLLP